MFKAYYEDIIKNGLENSIPYLNNSDDFFWIRSGQTTSLNFNSIKANILAHAKHVSYMIFEWKSLKISPLTSELENYTGVVKGEEIDESNTKKSFRFFESDMVIKRGSGT
jgi:hypothetical protein